jgi:hypothetical protein
MAKAKTEARRKTKYDYTGIDGGEEMGALGERVISGWQLDDELSRARLDRVSFLNFIAGAGKIAAHTRSIIAAREAAWTSLKYHKHSRFDVSYALLIVKNLELVASYTQSAKPVRETSFIVEHTSDQIKALETAEALGRFAEENRKDRLPHRTRMIVYDKIAKQVDPGYSSKY